MSENTEPKPPEDITPPPFEDIDWSDNKSKALKEIYSYVTGVLTASINWYIQEKGKKKRQAIRLRQWAIYATASAGILPLLQQIFASNPIKVPWNDYGLGKLFLAQGWSAIFLAIAATLTLRDKFFGYSTSWVRFIQAETQLQRILLKFQLDWELEKALWTAEDAPTSKQTSEQAVKQVQLAQKCLMDSSDTIQKETDLWVQEFTSILSQYNSGKDKTHTPETPQSVSAKK